MLHSTDFKTKWIHLGFGALLGFGSLLAMTIGCSGSIRTSGEMDDSAVETDVGGEPDGGDVDGGQVDGTTVDGAVDGPPVCIDDDGDGYGENCAAGPDCDDTSDLCTTECEDADGDAIWDCKDDCIAQSSEDCFDADGIDEDCNGSANCADPACSSIGECCATPQHCMDTQTLCGESPADCDPDPRGGDYGLCLGHDPPDNHGVCEMEGDCLGSGHCLDHAWCTSAGNCKFWCPDDGTGPNTEACWDSPSASSYEIACQWCCEGRGGAWDWNISMCTAAP